MLHQKHAGQIVLVHVCIVWFKVYSLLLLGLAEHLEAARRVLIGEVVTG